MNGKVTPNDDSIANPISASLIAREIAAGAAMYDALATSVPKINTLPCGKSNAHPIKIPINARQQGATNAKVINRQ